MSILAICSKRRQKKVETPKLSLKVTKLETAWVTSGEYPVVRARASLYLVIFFYFV